MRLNAETKCEVSSCMVTAPSPTERPATPFRWSKMIVDHDHPQLRRLLAGRRPHEVVRVLRADDVRLVDLVGVVHHGAEPALELLNQRLVHDLRIVRRSLEADPPTVDRQPS